MAKYTATATADGNVYLCKVIKPRALTEWYATVHVIGTFGGGTVTLATSVDGGTTIVPIPTDQFSLTANGADNVDKLGVTNTLDGAIELYATIAGATTPDLTITVHDNR